MSVCLSIACPQVVAAAPSAELRPLENTADANDYSQTDEEDMGMSYDELSVFGYLRKCELCGPVQMFRKLSHLWGASSERKLPLAEIAAKVKRFFYFYAINRHKMTTLTPSYHAESYSPDDNRYAAPPLPLPAYVTRTCVGSTCGPSFTTRGSRGSLTLSTTYLRRIISRSRNISSSTTWSHKLV